MHENAPKTKSKAEIEAEIAANNEKIETARMSFDGVEEGNLEAANNALRKQLETLGEALPSAEANAAETTQVESMGGSKENLEEATAGVDGKITKNEEEIKGVEKSTEEKVAEVKAEGGAEQAKTSKAEREQKIAEAYDIQKQAEAEMQYYIVSGDMKKYGEASIKQMEAMKVVAEANSQGLIEAKGEGNDTEWIKKDLDEKLKQLDFKIQGTREDPTSQGDYHTLKDKLGGLNMQGLLGMAQKAGDKHLEDLIKKGASTVEGGGAEQLKAEYLKLGEKIMEGPKKILSTITPEEKRKFASENPNQGVYLDSFLDDMHKFQGENGSSSYENSLKYIKFLGKVRGEDYSKEIPSFEEVQELRKRQDEIRTKI